LQCPECGVFYAKYEEYIESQENGENYAKKLAEIQKTVRKETFKKVNSKNPMEIIKWINVFAIIGICVFWVLAVRQENKLEIKRLELENKKYEEQHEKDFDKCIKLGISYYKTLEAYPYLTTTGERAIDVITKACNHNTAVFDGCKEDYC
jgi:hypothetical protein